MNVQPSMRARLMIRAQEGWHDVLSGAEGYFKRMAGASELEMLEKDAQITEKTVSAVCSCGEFFIPLGELVDLEKEKKRLQKEMDNLKNEIARGQGKLNNPGFLSKAPAQLVEAEKEKLEKNAQMIAALEARIAELG